MPNPENIEKYKYSSDQNREKASENGRKGGKKSGEIRRKKANFRKTLQMLMQLDIDAGDITAMLKSMGIEPTVENTVNFALVMQAITGDPKAYREIRATLGLSDKTELDEKEQKARIKEKAGEGKDTAGLKSFLSAVGNTEEAVKEIFEDETAEG